MKRQALILAAVALITSMPSVGQTQVKAPLGPVAITVRLPNPAQKLLYVREVMAVKPGPLTLYYPKWIPGDHSPDGSIGTMMGLEVTAGSQPISWQRDAVDMFAFHLTVPTGVDQIDIRFRFPTDDRVTPHLMDITWIRWRYTKPVIRPRYKYTNRPW